LGLQVGDVFSVARQTTDDYEQMREEARERLKEAVNPYDLHPAKLVVVPHPEPLSPES